MEPKNNYPEAPASATVKVKSPKGFEYLFTMRDEKVSSLMEKIEFMEGEFLEKQWTPLAQNSFPKKEKAPTEYVEGRLCPVDHARLVYKTTKTGKKFIKCENGKWDFAQQKATGCIFTEWPKEPVGNMSEPI